MRIAKCLVVFLFLIRLDAIGAQQIDMDHTPFQIGTVNYFGYGGIDLAAVRNQIPLKAGDTITFATFSEDPTNTAILRMTGHVPTDIGIVCCDDAKHLLIFIGLGGTSSRTLNATATPNGTDHLEPAALKLYDQGMAALMVAIKSGNAGEDDSQGYMLSNDPALRKINVAMRDYAMNREAEFVRVMQHASDPKQRRAAAAFLGYALRSSAQVAALVQAVNDSDDEVRNNAVRALSVLSAAKGADAIVIDAQPLVALVFSGKWTDRNKGSLLLMRLTERRDPRLLETLRKQALEPLIEGASWKGDPGHSYLFLGVLGRIAGIPEQTLQKMIADGNTEAIIDAAKNTP